MLTSKRWVQRSHTITPFSSGQKSLLNYDYLFIKIGVLCAFTPGSMDSAVDRVNTLNSIVKKNKVMVHYQHPVVKGK